MNKKAGALLISFFLLISLLGATLGSIIDRNEQENQFSQERLINGRGIYEDPYKIYDVYDLQNMNNNLSAHYALANDIDADETREWNDGAGFEPIGELDAPFTGSFDGRNHTITGLHIDRPNTAHVGLFGIIGQEGRVRNVGLVDMCLNGDRNVGGLVGRNRGTVNNSYATGRVDGRYTTGGFVGRNEGTVSNSYATGNVSGTDHVGGLVGYNSHTVTNSYATGVVSGDEYVGGLVGSNGEGTVENSYTTGRVFGNNGVGGLVGMNWRGTVSNSFYNIDSVLINDGHHITIGGIFDTQYQNWYSNGLYLDITNYSNTLVPSGNYYEISKVQGIRDLLGFAWNDSYSFRLSSDIDLSSEPDLYIPYLNAEFDGENYTFHHLTIDKPFIRQLGMFGYVGPGGEIKNLGVVDADVSGDEYVGGLVGWNRGAVSNSYVIGKVNGSYTVGGLVGRNEGMINDSHVTKDVSGESSYVGGLVGDNWGTVSNSHATGNVSGRYYVGGLVGYNSRPVSNSYATGDVSGNEYVGGLVGYNRDTIDNSYATGNVSGFSRLGGLVGDNSRYRANGIILYSYSTGDVNGDNLIGGLIGSNDGEVSNTYSTGKVTGNNFVGGLIGGHGGHYGGDVSYSYAIGKVSGTRDVGGLIGYSLYQVSSSFYDSNTTGQSDVGKGVPKTTAEMINVATFIDMSWNITTVDDVDDRNINHIWNIVDQGTYPFFSWEEMVSVSTHKMNLTIEGEGITDPVGGMYYYPYNTEVTVTGAPDEGWYFSHWSGDVPEGQEESEEITIVMDRDKTVTAHFEQIYHNLTIAVEEGGNTVPEDGNHSYTYDTEINITATADEGWYFSHWSGDVPEGQEEINEITIVMDSNKTVTAHFEQIYHNLTIAVEGRGNTEPGEGNYSIEYGAEVDITAAGDKGWYFSHWSGDVLEGEETNENITIVMDQNKSLTAHFQELLFQPENVSLYVTPSEGEVPLKVTVTISASNAGLLEGSIDVEIDDVIVHTLYIPAEDAVEFTFEHTFDSAGTYEIVFGDLSESVVVREVEEDDSDLPLGILLLIVALGTALAVFLFMIKRERDEKVQTNIDEELLEGG